MTTVVLGSEGELVSVEPVRLGLVGCGAHAYRNTLPPLRHIPEAVVTSCCDTNAEKARLYARTLGGDAQAHGDVAQMLDAGGIDAALVVTGFADDSGVPLYPDVVDPILRAGLPVFMEKPPAADAAGVARMIAAAAAGGTFAQVGFKKVYSPAIDRLAGLMRLPAFGGATSYSYGYDVDLPAVVGDLRTPSGRRFLDDFVHVASVIDRLFGPPASVQAVRGPTGAGVVVNRHADGVVGVVSLSNLSSGLSPIERLEVLGRGANAVLENGVHLRYYPPGHRGPYGTSTSYLPPIEPEAGPDFGPRLWEPEFSLGNLHGGSHFLQGYYHQLRAFVDAVRSRVPPQHCGLDAALRVMTYVDALAGEFGEWRQVEGQPPVEYAHVPDSAQELACPRTGRPLVMKDGWNYVCRDCGRTRTGEYEIAFTCGLDGG